MGEDRSRRGADLTRSSISRTALIAVAVLLTLTIASVVVAFLDRGDTYEVVFAPGASNADDQATAFAQVPHRRIDDVVWLELRPGDSLHIRNLDSELHQVAGVTVRPQETVLHTFRERGVFSDACSLDLTVFVEVGPR
jgi:hypothetical protein